MKTFLAILALSFTFITPQVMASDVYVRANVGMPQITVPSAFTGASQPSKTNEYGRYALGYRFNSPFAIELGYTESISQSFKGSSGPTYTLKSEPALDVSVLGYVWEGLYAKIGISDGKTTLTNSSSTYKQEKTGTTPVFGVGYDYNVFKYTDVNIEYINMPNYGGFSDQNIQAVSLGIKVKY